MHPPAVGPGSNQHSASSLPEELAERNDIQAILQQAIDTLPPKFRAVVLLRYASQLSFAEIGQALNMPDATAKTYFQRAKPLLRAALTPQLHPAATGSV